MNAPIIQLLVLAAIAVFLIIRLKNVLGTREGYEKPPVTNANTPQQSMGTGNMEVIDGGLDPDITDHVPAGSPSADALARMKGVEPSFNVTEFLSGARSAYEMILMAFERGDLSDVTGIMAPDVRESFEEVVAHRREQGITVEAEFIGINEMSLAEAEFDDASRLALLTIRYSCQLTEVVRDAEGNVIGGAPDKIKSQRDVWTFERVMGSENPNWQLAATGE